MSAPITHEPFRTEPLEPRADRLGMRWVGGETIIHTGPDQANKLYTPRDIGLQPDEWRDYSHISVVGELALPVLADHERQIAHAAILRVENRNGAMQYALQALYIDHEGRALAVPGPGGRAFIDSHGKLAIGHDADLIVRPGDRGLATAAQLWGEGTFFDDSVDVLFTPGNNRLHMYNAGDSKALLRATVTAVTAYTAMETMVVQGVAEQRGMLDKQGRFAGYPTVSHHTAFGGNNPPAVDLRSWGYGREAIVIDDRESPAVAQEYQNLRSSFLAYVTEARARHANGSVSEAEVLNAIYKAVGGAMEYDRQYVDELANHVNNQYGEYRLVNLAMYLHARRGVCHQMNLAQAWLAGEAAELGLLQGKMTVRCKRSVTNPREGHAFARYENPVTGDVYILDTTPPQPFCGRLEDSLTHIFNYFDPGEREEYLSRRATHARLRSVT